MKVTQGHALSGSSAVETDICVVGSGAGGGVVAWQLAQAGHRVLMLEAGGYHPTPDFKALDERVAYPMLYQERMARATKDAAISVLQGRGVGGGTTVNWTTCFRTPERILEHWRQEHGLDLGDMAPHFQAVEQRLGVATWPIEAANPNNLTLWRGAQALGWQAAPLARNVAGCVSSGYCGLGCAFGAKQSMLLTTLPDAVQAGMQLYSDCWAERVVPVAGGWQVQVQVLDRATMRASGAQLLVKAKRVVLAGGAINSPAVLLRSEINPSERVGMGTCIHPVVAVAGRYAERIEGWSGAPQAVGSHEFVDRGDKVGFFLEVPPMQPMLVGSGVMSHGPAVAEFMRALPHLSTHLALMVDGLSAQAPGGRVVLQSNGQPKLDYPVTPGLVEGFRAAHIAMARCHLAAGAEQVLTLHPTPVLVSSQDELSSLEGAPYGALEHSIFTAHQMGGCAMGGDPARSVCDPQHRVREQQGLYVVDGSVLPTSLGVNPSETIYAIAHRAAGLIDEDT